jgi:hypothetical protein
MMMEASDIQEFETNSLRSTIVAHTRDGTIATFSIAKEVRVKKMFHAKHQNRSFCVVQLSIGQI